MVETCVVEACVVEACVVVACVVGVSGVSARTIAPAHSAKPANNTAARRNPFLLTCGLQGQTMSHQTNAQSVPECKTGTSSGNPLTDVF